MSLHIALDGSRLARSEYTGTEHYTFELFRHIFRVAPHHTYTIYSPAQPSRTLPTGQASVTWAIRPFPRLWTLLRLSAAFLSSPQPDVLFVPAHIPPLVHPPTVTTVHDVAFRQEPRYYSWLARLGHELALRHTVAASAHLITVSESTAADVRKAFGERLPPTSVIAHGVDQDRFHPPTISESPTPAIRAAGAYIYSIGRLEAKKHTPELIRAFRVLRERLGSQHHLVLAGKPGSHGYPAVQQALDELPSALRDAVHVLGYIDDDEHAQWLRFASCFAFPSGYEGFGMPVLEAMASGTPVVTSRSSSLPELVGDAGVLVNQTRVEAIAEGIASVLQDPAYAQSLAARGRKRATTFTWERAARETVAVLEHVAQGRHHG